MITFEPVDKDWHMKKPLDQTVAITFLFIGVGQAVRLEWRRKFIRRYKSLPYPFVVDTLYRLLPFVSQRQNSSSQELSSR